MAGRARPESDGAGRAKRPAFQHYPGDEQRDVAVAALSLAAFGLWRRMINLMHAGEPYGHLAIAGAPIEAAELARLVGENPSTVRRLLGELETRKVFSRTEAGVIYCRRMVRDEYLRTVRAAGGIKSLEHPNVQQPKQRGRAGKDGEEGGGEDHGKGTLPPHPSDDPCPPSYGGSPAVAVASASARENCFPASTSETGDAPSSGGATSVPTRCRRAAPVSDEASAFDLAPFVDAWRAVFGGDPPGGRFGKVLRRLVVAKGYGMSEVLRRWGIYLAAKGDYATPEDFAAKWDRYAEAPAVSAGAAMHHPRAVQFLELVTRNRLATCVGEQVPAQLQAMEARGEIRSAEGFFRLFARLDRNVLRNAPSPHLALRHIEETLGDDLLRPGTGSAALVDGAVLSPHVPPLSGAAVA